MNRILICRTCKQQDGRPVEAALISLTKAMQNAALDEVFKIETVDCMGACEQPVSLAFQGKARAAYLFAGLTIPDDLDDIVATARAYLDAKDGWIEDARPCGRLRFCLRARIPAL
ncbi:DUF1636 domain-containing protein [uncultured Roseibium sp.]|uniref:DUF1636 domain-containing protein n=1 Tax=uncultured Roseibium sp. TaxID=1936171 RepID=UPI002629BC81|nr:DUF1636 domain-containing protein [uncultured Roseibium sp.]